AEAGDEILGIKELNQKLGELGSEKRIFIRFDPFGNPDFIRFGAIDVNNITEGEDFRIVRFTTEDVVTGSDEYASISPEPSEQLGEGAKKEIIIHRSRIAKLVDQLIAEAYDSGKKANPDRSLFARAMLRSIGIISLETAEAQKQQIVELVESGIEYHERGHGGALKDGIPELNEQLRPRGHTSMYDIYEAIADFHSRGRLAHIVDLSKTYPQRATSLLFAHLFMKIEKQGRISSLVYELIYKRAISEDESIDFKELEKSRKAAFELLKESFSKTNQRLDNLEQELRSENPSITDSDIRFAEDKLVQEQSRALEAELRTLIDAKPEILGADGKPAARPQIEKKQSSTVDIGKEEEIKCDLLRKKNPLDPEKAGRILFEDGVISTKPQLERFLDGLSDGVADGVRKGFNKAMAEKQPPAASQATGEPETKQEMPSLTERLRRIGIRLDANGMLSEDSGVTAADKETLFRALEAKKDLIKGLYIDPEVEMSSRKISSLATLIKNSSESGYVFVLDLGAGPQVYTINPSSFGLEYLGVSEAGKIKFRRLQDGTLFEFNPKELIDYVSRYGKGTGKPASEAVSPLAKERPASRIEGFEVLGRGVLGGIEAPVEDQTAPEKDPEEKASEEKPEPTRFDKKLSKLVRKMKGVQVFRIGETRIENQTQYNRTREALDILNIQKVSVGYSRVLIFTGDDILMLEIPKSYRAAQHGPAVYVYDSRGKPRRKLEVKNGAFRETRAEGALIQIYGLKDVVSAKALKFVETAKGISRHLGALRKSVIKYITRQDHLTLSRKNLGEFQNLVRDLNASLRGADALREINLLKRLGSLGLIADINRAHEVIEALRWARLKYRFNGATESFVRRALGPEKSLADLTPAEFEELIRDLHRLETKAKEVREGKAEPDSLNDLRESLRTEWSINPEGQDGFDPLEAALLEHAQAVTNKFQNHLDFVEKLVSYWKEAGFLPKEADIKQANIRLAQIEGSTELQQDLGIEKEGLAPLREAVDEMVQKNIERKRGIREAARRTKALEKVYDKYGQKEKLNRYEIGQIEKVLESEFAKNIAEWELSKIESKYGISKREAAILKRKINFLTQKIGPAPASPETVQPVNVTSNVEVYATALWSEKMAEFRAFAERMGFNLRELKNADLWKLMQKIGDISQPRESTLEKLLGPYYEEINPDRQILAEKLRTMREAAKISVPELRYLTQLVLLAKECGIADVENMSLEQFTKEINKQLNRVPSERVTPENLFKKIPLEELMEWIEKTEEGRIFAERMRKIAGKPGSKKWTRFMKGEFAQELFGGMLMWLPWELLAVAFGIKDPTLRFGVVVGGMHLSGEGLKTIGTEGLRTGKDLCYWAYRDFKAALKSGAKSKGLLKQFLKWKYPGKSFLSVIREKSREVLKNAISKKSMGVMVRGLGSYTLASKAVHKIEKLFGIELQGSVLADGGHMALTMLAMMGSKRLINRFLKQAAVKALGEVATGVGTILFVMDMIELLSMTLYYSEYSYGVQLQLEEHWKKGEHYSPGQLNFKDLKLANENFGKVMAYLKYTLFYPEPGMVKDGRESSDAFLTRVSPEDYDIDTIKARARDFLVKDGSKAESDEAKDIRKFFAYFKSIDLDVNSPGQKIWNNLLVIGGVEQFPEVQERDLIAEVWREIQNLFDKDGYLLENQVDAFIDLAMTARFGKQTMKFSKLSPESVSTFSWKSVNDDLFAMERQILAQRKMHRALNLYLEILTGKEPRFKRADILAGLSNGSRDYLNLDNESVKKAIEIYHNRVVESLILAYAKKDPVAFSYAEFSLYHFKRWIVFLRSAYLETGREDYLKELKLLGQETDGAAIAAWKSQKEKMAKALRVYDKVAKDDEKLEKIKEAKDVYDALVKNKEDKEKIAYAKRIYDDIVRENHTYGELEKRMIISNLKSSFDELVQLQIDLKEIEDDKKKEEEYVDYGFYEGSDVGLTEMFYSQMVDKPEDGPIVALSSGN
ncbi:hypothetical protein AMJ44_09760, partial [candidate division WOR-1 bacterium DG_54_3]